jgi:hypothetical protein
VEEVLETNWRLHVEIGEMDVSSIGAVMQLTLVIGDADVPPGSCDIGVGMTLRNMEEYTY